MTDGQFSIYKIDCQALAVLTSEWVDMVRQCDYVNEPLLYASWAWLRLELAKGNS